ncbi:protodermal factor 1-like [Zingiber officinale]|uniref:protodermal factor 1-like n=1 Tax=Zingiber officinale TaxID=94328 RepID=UPI001C4D4E50|nr:protodermal factor 1-like [Zingiber officinale]
MECCKCFVVCFLLLVLASPNVGMSRSLQEQEQEQEQKNFYPPLTGTSPSHSNGGAPDCSTPSGGASHATPTPYHHGSGSYGTPTPDKGTPSTPGGGYYNSPPATGGGGEHSSPAYPSPSTPAVNPQIPPFFTGTCRYWGSHPEIIAAILGSLGNIGDIFGHGCSAFFGSNPSLPAALTNTRPDGYGELFREGTAAFLNSMVNSKFPYTTPQVKSAFVGSITSYGAAQAQADVFKQANEAR